MLWVSDIHFEKTYLLLNGRDVRDGFLHEIWNADFDFMLITGDISDSRHLERDLLSISEAAAHRSVYFVLGNHDFYGSSFGEVDSAVARICCQRRNLHHLGHREIIEATQDTYLIGIRGWADGKAGHGRNTTSPFKDAKFIADFKGDSRATILSKMTRLGQASGEYFQEMAAKTLLRSKNVIVATHVPPFVSAAYFNDEPCSKTALPFFTNISAGARLKQCISEHPGKQLTVYCGHTHTAYSHYETPALHVRVAAPRDLRIIEVR